MSNSYSGMRHLNLILMSCLTVLLTGCSSGFLQESEREKGAVRLFLGQDISEGQVRTVTDLALPDVAEFKVEIYDARGYRRYRDTYGNSEGRTIPLNAGAHRLLAQYGDSTGVGFNAAYFIADQQFEVKGQEITPLHAVAKPGKVKVSVEFGESITSVYQDWYAQVRTEQMQQLRFVKGEVRAGYFPAGKLVLEVYVQEQGQWKRFVAAPQEGKAGEFVQFSLDTSAGAGNVNVTVKVDNSLETVDKAVEIPSDMAPSEKPSINMRGVQGTAFKLYEANGMEGVVCRADIVAPAGISTCVLEVVSSQESSGLTVGQYDLIAPSPEVRAALEAAGLRWLHGMEQKRLSYVDFSGMMEQIGRQAVYIPDQSRLAEFRLRVSDSKGREIATENYTFDVFPSEAVVRVAEADVWASEIKTLTVDVLAGDPSFFRLQYRRKGTQDYLTAAPATVEGKKLIFNALQDLEPGADHEIRTIYNENPHNVIPDTVITTEAALQLGNAGFEEWTEKIFEFPVIMASGGKQKWYLPWASGEQWWAVNSRKTMQGKPSNWNFTYKIFPTVGYTAAVSASGRSAQVTSIAVAAWAIPGQGGYATTAGELWIGTADDQGNHKTDGHVFASRPSKLSYWVLNRPAGGESTRVLLEVRAADGTVIGKAEKVDATVDRTARQETLDIIYSDLTKKAATIYLSIRSSTAGSPVYSDRALEMAGTTYHVHAGSMINVDELNLIY